MNQEPGFYITSISNLIDETLTFLPTLFVNKMIKKRMNTHIKVVAQLSKVVKWNKGNQHMEPMHVTKESGRNIFSDVDFSKIRNVIKYFTELNYFLENKILIFLSHKVKE